MRPITPEEAAEKRQAMPDHVIEAFNGLIERYYDGRQAVIKQDDFIAAIKGIGEYQDWFLNIEPIYELAGWDVEYEKSDYTSTASSVYRLTKKQ